jgi:hypothetical protein
MALQTQVRSLNGITLFLGVVDGRGTATSHGRSEQIILDDDAVV